MPQIAVFDNGAFVDTSGGAFAESDSTQAALASFGHTVTTYTATTAAAVTAALTGKAVVVIPETEVGTYVPDAATADAYEAFVTNGGVMVVHGFSGDQAAFLNAVFGFSITQGTFGVGTTTRSGSLPSDLTGLPATLPGNDGTEGLLISSLPAGSQVIYSSGADASLVRIPVGEGFVVFAGWDWFNGAPLGGQDGGWLAAYDIVIDATTLPTANDDIITATGTMRVGYYDMASGQGVASQTEAIIAAGHTPVLITSLSAAELADIDVLLVQNSNNSGYGAEYLANLANINAAVADGLRLIIHDRFVDNAESILPGSGGFTIIRDADAPPADINNLDFLNNAHSVTSGPGGLLDDNSLDGGTFSSHGFAIGGTLPAGADLILARAGDATKIVTFSYSFGAGSVVYSSIPIDAYLSDTFGAGGNTIQGKAEEYLANLIDYVGDELASPNEDYVFTINDDDLLANDTDPTGDPLTITAVSPVSAAGVAVTLAGGVISYDPRPIYQYLNLGESAVDTFTYTITDGEGGFDTATVLVTVAGRNDPVTIVGAQATGTAQETGFDAGGNPFINPPAPTGQIFAVDPDTSAVLTWSVVGGGDSPLGALVVDQNGVWTYIIDQAAADYLALGASAVENFTVRVTDENGSFADQAVSITIQGANDKPVIEAGTTTSATIGEVPDGSMGENIIVHTVTGSGFFSDVDTFNTHTVSVTPQSGGYLGTFTLGPVSEWVYNPATNTSYRYVPASTTWTAANAAAAAEGYYLATVTSAQENAFIQTLLGGNDAWLGGTDQAVEGQFRWAGGPEAGNLLTYTNWNFGEPNNAGNEDYLQMRFDGLWNDLPSFSTLGYVLEAPGNVLDRFTWTLSVPDSALDYLAEGETLTQVYNITVTDNDGGSVTYSVTAILVGDNDAAILSSDSETIVQSAVPGTATGDLSISDVDGPETFQVQSNTAGAYGSFSVDANGVWVYNAYSAYTELDAGETLTDTFVVLATDGTPTSVTVTIVGIDDDSNARPDFFTTDEATAITGDLLADNGAGADFDPDNSLTVTRINGQPFTPGSTITLDSGALLIVNSDGTFTYDPNDAFNSLTAVAGTSNQRDFDTFTYQLSDGSGAVVQVQINGLNSPEDVLIGYTGVDNVIYGTPGPDRFFLQNGGDDQAFGLEGNDGFYMGAALGPLDQIDGGPNIDTVAIQGNYPGLTLGAITNVEVLAALSGSVTTFGDTANNRYDYNITTTDQNVAAGAILTVQADTLLAGEDLVFNGSAETNGAFRIFAGRGNDVLTGGAGNDGFFFGADGNLTGADRIDGGGGTDSVALRGNYVGGQAVTFQNATMVNVETLVFLSGLTNEFGGTINPAGFDYDVTLADGNVAAGQQLAVIAVNLASMESLTFNGSAETNGTFRILSGAGNDVLTGGAGADLIFGGNGADVMNGGGGADTYLYTATSQSTQANMDQITLGTGDRIDLGTIDANVNAAGNQAFAWIGAGAFTGVAGQMRATNVGNVWTVQGDTNGDGLADFVLQVATPVPLTGGEFIF